MGRTPAFERAEKKYHEALSSLRNEGLNLEEALADVEPNMSGLPEAYNGAAIEYCMEQFLDSELDFETPGTRGLGRITDTVPRYGGYFRKSLRNLSTDKISQVRQLMQDQIFSGYLSHCYWGEEPLARAEIRVPEDLYQGWVPAIYSAATRGPISEDFAQVLSATATMSFQEHKSFLMENGFKAGGFLSRDQTDSILFHYPLAGTILRRVEIGWT